MPVLDTNFLIALDMQEPAALALLEELKEETLLVPDIVAVEYLTPFGERAADAHDELARAFTLAAASRDWVLAATQLRERLRREGRSIRLADFWIASWARLHETFVVTRNGKDFEQMGIASRGW